MRRRAIVLGGTSAVLEDDERAVTSDRGGCASQHLELCALDINLDERQAGLPPDHVVEPRAPYADCLHGRLGGAIVAPAESAVGRAANNVLELNIASGVAQRDVVEGHVVGK